MWVCKKCNEENEDSFESCWKCTSDEIIEQNQYDEPNDHKKELSNKQKIFAITGFVLVFIFMSFVAGFLKLNPEEFWVKLLVLVPPFLVYGFLKQKN